MVDAWKMSLEDFVEAEKERLGFYNLSGDRQQNFNLWAVEQRHFQSVCEALRQGQDVPPAARPPWALTKAQFESRLGVPDEYEEHAYMVELALKEGLPVPADVLAEY